MAYGHCAPKRRIGSGLVAPPPPLSWALILGPKTPSKSGLKKAEFFRFFGPCGAPPRGGGGAPPTTLILLRNQPTPRGARDAPAQTGLQGRSGGRGGHSRGVRKGEKGLIVWDAVGSFEACFEAVSERPAAGGRRGVVTTTPLPHG